MPVAWVPIVLEDLNNYLVGAQVAAINTAAMAAGQVDRFPRVMTDVTQRIRLKIESCVNNRISSTALTIPPSLRGGACLLIIQGMQASIPALKLTQDQKDQIETFQKDLDLIANCKLSIEIPTDPLEPGDAQVGGAIQVISSGTRITTRDRLTGL